MELDLWGSDIALDATTVSSVQLEFGQLAIDYVQQDVDYDAVRVFDVCVGEYPPLAVEPDPLRGYKSITIRTSYRQDLEARELRAEHTVVRA